MPRYSNNSLAGLGLGSPISSSLALAPVSLSFATSQESCNIEESSSAASPIASSTTRSAAEASAPVPVLSAAVSSVVVSTPLVPTSSVLSSVPCSAGAVFPLPYVPHLPWPSSSLQLPPVSAQQQSFSTLPSSVSQSSLFTSRPSCLSGPVPGSLSQTVNQLNPIHQPVLPNPIAQQVPPIPISQQTLRHPVPHQLPTNPIPQQAPPAALHQQAWLPQITQHQLGSPMLQPSPTRVAATYQPIVQHAGLGQRSGMSGQVPHLAEAFVAGPGFLPIPYKTAVAITSGQFVDLSSPLVKPSGLVARAPIGVSIAAITPLANLHLRLRPCHQLRPSPVLSTPPHDSY